MDNDFIILPRIIWQHEHQKWSPVKKIRVRVQDIRRYEEYELKPEQRSSTRNNVTKVVYVKYAEQTNDQVMVRTDHMVVDMDLKTVDRLFNVEEL